MSFQAIRNYYAEAARRLKTEWKFYQQAENEDLPVPTSLDTDFLRIYNSVRNKKLEQANAHAAEVEYQRLQNQLYNPENKESFQFYSNDPPSLPADRTPAPGIAHVPRTYHLGRQIHTSADLPETGFAVDPPLENLVRDQFPQFLFVIDKFCRPLGSTGATFNDFNKEQIQSAPVDPALRDRILTHVTRMLNAKPFLPLHFVDTAFAGLPLSTGTGYHNRHSLKIKAHAKVSAPPEYQQKPTSKGYFYNAFNEFARDIIHQMKNTATPFVPSQDPEENRRKWNSFVDRYPTLLFTRSQISKRSGPLKTRPVYAVDDLFLKIEIMLTFPLHIMARSMHSSIMYGLETLRGGNVYLDRLAQKYSSYFTIDWSSFDQRVPRVITDIFFSHFLPSLIIISDGYQPSREYPVYPDLTPEKMFTRMDNLLTVLHTWFNNMTFLSQDGYAYRRLYAGIPSGLLNTQYLDSFVNLFVLVDGLIAFGATDDDIIALAVFVMGDDNTCFTHWPLWRLDLFLSFFEHYALTRWNMVLSKTKSVLTDRRNEIESLSYQCNFGSPLRPLDKLTAQLLYPERSLKRHFMSMRAVGIAYAAAGMSLDFHRLCQSVYDHYLPYLQDHTFTLEDIEKFKRRHAYQIFASEEELNDIDITRFPSIEEVRDIPSKWHGPLPTSTKWNEAHFVLSVYDIPSPFMTISDYRKKHDIPIRMPEQFVPTNN